MTSTVESPADSDHDVAQLTFCENEARNELIIEVPTSCSRGLPKKIRRVALKTGLVRNATIDGYKITCVLRPRSNMTLDEVAGKVQRKIEIKYEHNQKAARPESNTERRKKERLLNQPALART